MNDAPGDDEPLLFRYVGGEPPYVPLRLDVIGFSQIVLATIRPDLPRSRVAAQWAAALDLSQGSFVLAQLVSSLGEDARNWGPCEQVWPEVDDDLDYSISYEGVGGFLLGRDFLDKVSVAFVGPLGIVAFARGGE